MTTSTDPIVLADAVQLLRDQHEIIDAFHRFAVGHDRGDAALLRSAFAPHARIDWSQPARRFGVAVPALEDRAAIEALVTTLTPFDTTHAISNVRSVVDGDRAHSVALVEALHVRRSTPRDRVLLTHFYDTDLVRDGDRWIIEQIVVHNVSHVGAPSVLFDSASPDESDAEDRDDRALDEIRAVVARLEHAQQRELVDEFVALFRADAIWTTAHGRLLVSRDEIAAFTASVLPGAMAESMASYQVERVVFVRPDVAAVKVRQRQVTLDGQPIADAVEGTPMYVMSRKDDGWRLVACQNTMVHDQ
jgi:uncharacterized protein (TIGR02246 family)